MKKINIDLLPEQTTACAKLLNELLANEFTLYTKTLNYHWNITGPSFGALHLFLKEQYEELLEITDSVAERITALGHRAFGTLHEFSSHKTIEEIIGTSPSWQGMLKDLLVGHEFIIRSIRASAQKTLDEYNDLGTNNFLANVLEKHEKMAWMLRAHLE